MEQACRGARRPRSPTRGGLRDPRNDEGPTAVPAMGPWSGLVWRGTQPPLVAVPLAPGAFWVGAAVVAVVDAFFFGAFLQSSTT